jgi:putative Ca2+/H+ antiporter (TMEM165/GDT1 family)
VLAGVLVATIANHALAASVGMGVASAVPSRALAVVVALGFFAFGVWMLAADGLAVFGGAALAARLPMRYLRWAAAALFWIFGLLALTSVVRSN